MTNYLETIENVRNYLGTAGHNTVAENLECSSSTGFLIESLFSDQRIILKVRIDSNIDTIIVEGYPMITIPTHDLGVACQYLMSKTSQYKVGYIGIDDNRNVYSHVESSFKDAPISEETFEDLEHIAISILVNNFEEIQKLTKDVLSCLTGEDNELDLESLIDLDDDKSDINSFLEDLDFESLLAQANDDETVDEYTTYTFKDHLISMLLAEKFNKTNNESIDSETELAALESSEENDDD